MTTVALSAVLPSYQLPPPMRRLDVDALADILGITRPYDIGGNLYSVVELITPQMASQWLLDGNLSNRSKSAVNLSKLADDLKKNRWRLHHQGVAFRSDGKLLDGQHRLTEIAHTGVSAYLLITINVTDEAQRTIDSGKTRTLIDVAKIYQVAGVVDERRVATVRYAVNGFCPAKSSNTTWSHGKSLNIIETYRDGIEWVVERLNKGRITTGPIRAAVLLAWYNQPQHIGMLERFCHLMMAGQPPIDSPLTDGDRIVLSLRDSASATGRSAKQALELFSKSCNVIINLINNRNPRGLYKLPQSEIDSGRWHLPGIAEINVDDDDDNDSDDGDV